MAGTYSSQGWRLEGAPTLELPSPLSEAHLASLGLCLCPCRVSVAELQTHPELDTDGDGALSEGEAQVPALPLGLGLLEGIAPGDFSARDGRQAGCGLFPGKVPCWPWTRAAGAPSMADVAWHCLGSQEGNYPAPVLPALWDLMGSHGSHRVVATEPGFPSTCPDQLP